MTLKTSKKHNTNIGRGTIIQVIVEKLWHLWNTTVPNSKCLRGPRTTQLKAWN